jgi:sensor histidine kinase YesM
MLNRTITGFEPGGEEREHEHLGLNNVVSRLRLFYERDVRMTLEPRMPHGLRVIIIIPLKTGGR